MNIAFVGDYRSIHLQRWVNYFLKNNYNVTVFSDFTGEQINSSLGQLNFTPLLKKTGSSKLSTFLHIKKNSAFVARQMEEKKIQVLHCHYTNFYGWLGYLSGFHPIIQTIWGSDLMVNYNLIDKFLNRRSWQKADLVTVHSKYMEEKLRNRIRYHSNISLIRWGIDPEKFKPSKKNIALSKKLHFEGRKIIFCPRSLKPVYNITTIIKSIPNVIKIIPNALFVFCEYHNDANYYGLIKKISSELKILSHVLFVPAISHDEIVDYYHLSDIVISLSLSDGFPISVLESMASGVPTIVGAIPQLEEIKNDQSCYFINKLDNHIEVANAIIYILQNKNLMDSLISNGQKIAKNWDFIKAMKKFEKIYHSF